MRYAVFLAAVSLLGQTNPIGPESTIKGVATVQAWGNVIALYSTTFPGQPAQVMSCTPLLSTLPSISATVAGAQIVFACAGLALLPQLTCPAAFAIGPLAPGRVVGLWVGPGGLHVSGANGIPLSCTGCYQDATMSPYPGEYPVALCSVGGACVPTWTGVPALPVVTVPAGCSAVQSVSAVVVTCSPPGS
jgi:hypothetical protein